MTSVLKGNFKAAKEVAATGTAKQENLDEKFERVAMTRMGGSIAFVAKKKVVWDVKQ
jgi:hypothetical protein